VNNPQGHAKPASKPTVVDSLASARGVPLWLDTPARPPAHPALTADLTVDLAVVGGGFTGLWTALLAAEANPGRSIALIEAATLGWAASGRNGGFCSSSLTHGLANGLSRWPEELPTLLRLGAQTLDDVEGAVARYGIDCDFTRGGDLTVAVQPWQLDELQEVHAAAVRLGEPFELLDAEQTRALANSPSYLGGLLDRRGTAVLDPARLVWGLAAAAERLGVTIHERTRVVRVRDESARLRLDTLADQVGDRSAGGVARRVAGTVRARRVVLGTNAFPSPLRRVRPFVVPVWDHVLATEPLTERQWDDLGWHGGEGISDAGNRFHYYRTTRDRRVVWGGYDALYYYGSDLSPRRVRRPETERALAEHFFDTFPQLDGVRFSHAWAGAIDTSTRFTAFWRRGLGGKLAAVQGYTGLGVGASRFGAQVALDLVDGVSTERTALSMVRRLPAPFPPEPLRWAGITLTRRSIARADDHGGRRDLWLRTLDRLGLGFDS
jgi:glycine/D-amino acid oxidase-like deaminating enzyme